MPYPGHGYDGYRAFPLGAQGVRKEYTLIWTSQGTHQFITWGSLKYPVHLPACLLEVGGTLGETPHKAHDWTPDPELGTNTTCCVTVLTISFSKIPLKFAKYVAGWITVNMISYPDLVARSIVSESIRAVCQALLQMANQSENEFICPDLSTFSIAAQSS